MLYSFFVAIIRFNVHRSKADAPLCQGIEMYDHFRNRSLIHAIKTAAVIRYHF